MTDKPVEQSLVFEPNAQALHNINRIQRVGSWDQETYKTALQDAIEVRGYSRWIIGMLVTEVQEQWPHITCEIISQDLSETHKVSPSVLRGYAHTYRAFTKDNSGFVPLGYMPWSVMQLAANNKVEGKTPAQVLGELEDGGTTSIKGAYKKIKEDQTGVKLPPKPNLNVVVVGEGAETHFKVNVSKNTTKESLELMDWEDFMDQIMDIMDSNPFQN